MSEEIEAMPTADKLPPAEPSNVATLPVKRQPKPALVTGDAPRAIVPTTIEQVWRLAELAFASGLAPKDMDSPEKCSVAILHGLEVGLAPMQALQRICVINGRPTIWGDAVLGLVRASGRLESISEEVTGEGDKLVANCTVKRVGEAPVTRTFDANDAKAAGLWNKKGPWQDYRKRMMQMRARAFALRDVFPDVTGGMYLREELDESEMKDITPRSTEPPEPPEPDATPPATAPEPTEPPEPVAETTIPGFLRREDKPKTIEGQAVEVFDAEQWLKDLEGAFDGCEDATSLADAVSKYMTPQKDKVSAADFERAGQLSISAFQRITREQ